MAELEDIYQEVILEHAKSPRNFRVLEGTSQQAEGFNPLCGDKCKVYIAMDGDRIQDISFQATGCAISRASGSMMTQALKGKTAAEADEIFRSFHRMVRGENGKEDPADLGKLGAFAGVAGFPARVKCATLGWHTLEAALHGQHDPVTTE